MDSDKNTPGVNGHAGAGRAGLARPRGGFARLSNEVFDRFAATMGASAALVYWCLARHANRRGECYPSRETIGATCGLARATVGAAIDRLEELGLVEVVRGRTEKGYNRPNLYRVRELADQVQNLNLDQVQNLNSGMDQKLNLGPSSKIEPEQDTYCLLNKKSIEQVPPPTPQRGERVRSGFERFWEAYPRKADEGKARAEWGRLDPDPELERVILEAVERHRRSPKWAEMGGQFIPFPAKWLKGKRWQDGTGPSAEAPYTPEEHRRRMQEQTAFAPTAPPANGHAGRGGA